MNEADNAGEKTNATEPYVRKVVWMQQSIASLAEVAEKYHQPVYVRVELEIEPAGNIKVTRPVQQQPVWKQIEEMMEP